MSCILLLFVAPGENETKTHEEIVKKMTRRNKGKDSFIESEQKKNILF